VNSGDKNVYALDATTGAKVWNHPIDNDGFSSPAVANGVVYVASYSGTVYALNASTGDKLWSYRVGGTVESSPAVADGVVYIGSWDNNLYAFRLADSNKQEAAPKCPELKMLRPDLGLKVSQLGATVRQ